MLYFLGLLQHRTISMLPSGGHMWRSALQLGQLLLVPQLLLQRLRDRVHKV